MTEKNETFLIERCDDGDFACRRFEDIRRIWETHEHSGYTATVYVSIILTLYVLGIVMLLLHYVKQKYGTVTLYDLYLIPSMCCNKDDLSAKSGDQIDTRPSITRSADDPPDGAGIRVLVHRADDRCEETVKIL